MFQIATIAHVQLQEQDGAEDPICSTCFVAVIDDQEQATGPEVIATRNLHTPAYSNKPVEHENYDYE
jgi:hypothetical protein